MPQDPRLRASGSANVAPTARPTSRGLAPPPSTPADLRRRTANLSPAEVVRAFRAEFPDYKPEMADPDLYQDLKANYPRSIGALADPLLEGAESLMPLSQPPEGPQALPIVEPQVRAQTWGELGKSAATRIAPAISGAVAGGAVGGPPGAIAGGIYGGLGGEYFARQSERAAGTRAPVDMSPEGLAREAAGIGTAGLLSAPVGIPLRAAGVATRLAVRGAEGAGLGLVQQEIDRRLEGRPAPSLSERALVGGIGGALGAAGGGVEARILLGQEMAQAAEQIRRRALTREGLAGTLERVAQQAEASGLDQAAARSYAARATRALVQGRPVPDPPQPKIVTQLEGALQAPPGGARLKKPTGEVVATAAPVPESAELRMTLGEPPATGEVTGAAASPASAAAGSSSPQAPALRWIQSALDAERRSTPATVKAARAEVEGIRSDLLRTGAVRSTPSAAKFVQAIERFLTTGESSPEVEAAQMLAQKWMGAMDPASGKWQGTAKPTRAGSLERLTLWNEQGPQFVLPQRTPGRGVPGLLEAPPPLRSMTPPPDLGPPRMELGQPPVRTDGAAGDIPSATGAAAAGDIPRAGEAAQPPPATPPPPPATDPRFWVAPPKDPNADLGEVAIRARAAGKDVIAEVEKAKASAARLSSMQPPPAVAGDLDLAPPPPGGRLYDPARDAAGAPIVELPDTPAAREAETLRVAAQPDLPPPTYAGPERRRGFEPVVQERRGVTPLEPPPIRAYHGSPRSDLTALDPAARSTRMSTQGAVFLSRGRDNVLKYSAPGGKVYDVNVRGRIATVGPEEFTGKEGFLGGWSEVKFAELRDRLKAAGYDGVEFPHIDEIAVWNKGVLSIGSHPLDPKGETGALRLPQRKPAFDFSVPPGDRPALQQWLASRRPAFGNQPWFRRAQKTFATDPARAWKIVQAARVGALPAGERQKLLAFAQARGEKGSVRVQYGGVRKSLEIPQPPGAKPAQIGKLRQSRSALLEGVGGMPEAANLPTISHDVVSQILKRTDRAKIAAIAGNTDPAYRVTRQIVHQILSENPKYRAVSAALGMKPDELARGLQETVSESARILNRISQFRRQAPPAFVDAFDRAVGPDVVSKISGIASEGDAAVKLYGGLFALDPAEAMQLLQRSIDAYDQAHLQWMLAREPKKLGAFHRFVNFTNATLTGTVEQFWRNGLMGAMRWDLGIVEDLVGASFALAYRPREGKILFKRAVDRVTALAHLDAAAARPWGDDILTMWPKVAQGLSDLSPRDFRHTLKWLSDSPDAQAAFLGREATDLPVNDFESKAVKAIQFWNRLQEYPLRAMATDLSMRTEIRRRGFDPNQVIAQDVPLATIFGSEEAAARALMKSVRDGNDFTYAGNAIRGTWNAKLIDLFRSGGFLTLLNRFSRFGLSAGPRYLWDRTPGALVEVLLARGMKGRLVHGLAVRRILDDALPARELRLRDISDREGRALQQKLALTADRRTMLRRLRSLEAMEEKVAAGQRAKLTPNAISSRLVDLRNRLRSTTNAINAFEGSLAAINHEKQTIKEQVKGLDAAFRRSSDAAAPESFAELMGRATLGSLMIGAAVAVAGRPNQQDLPWYQIRFGQPGEDEAITDIRAYGGMAQWFYMGKVLHEFYTHVDRAAFDQARAAGQSLLASTAAAYTGKYDFGRFLAEGAQALLSMNPTAGAQATLLDFLDPQRLTPEGIADGLMEFVGEIGAAAFQPLQSYRNLASAAFPEEGIVRSPRASEEAPLAELGAPIAKIPGLSQMIPPTVSQTSGEPLRSEKAWTRPLAGVTFVKPPNPVERELRAAGVDPRSIYVPNLPQTGLNQELARTHARSLRTIFAKHVFGARRWEALSTPEQRRDYLQRYILPAAKQMTKRDMVRLYGRRTMQGARETPGQREQRDRTRALIEAWAARDDMGLSEEQQLDEQRQQLTPPPSASPSPSILERLMPPPQ